jgi:hypothetical protein
MVGLHLNHYLPLLTDADLRDLLRWFLHGFDRAPTFCTWVTELLVNEQRRRNVAQAGGPPQDVDPVVMPILDWTNSDVADALHVVTATSFAAALSVHGSGFLDSLVIGVNVTADRRLRQMEECHASHD